MDILFASGNHALTAKPWWLLLPSLTHKWGPGLYRASNTQSAGLLQTNPTAVGMGQTLQGLTCGVR